MMSERRDVISLRTYARTRRGFQPMSRAASMNANSRLPPIASRMSRIVLAVLSIGVPIAFALLFVALISLFVTGGDL